MTLIRSLLTLTRSYRARDAEAGGSTASAAKATATLCLGEGVRRCVPNVFLKATLCLEEGVRRWRDPRALTLLDAQT